MLGETSVLAPSLCHVPYASLYSLREKTVPAKLENVFNAAVTATMSCHVGSQPVLCGRSNGSG